MNKNEVFNFIKEKRENKYYDLFMKIKENENYDN